MFHTASNVFFILLSVLFFNRYPFKCLFCVIATNRYFNFFLIITVCLCNSNKIRVYIGRNSQTFKPLRQPLGYQRLGDAIRIQRLLQGGELQLLQGRLGRGLAGLAGPGGDDLKRALGQMDHGLPQPGTAGHAPQAKEDGDHGGSDQCARKMAETAEAGRTGHCRLGRRLLRRRAFLAGSLLQEPLEGCLRVQFQAQGLLLLQDVQIEADQLRVTALIRHLLHPRVQFLQDLAGR